MHRVRNIRSVSGDVPAPEDPEAARACRGRAPQVFAVAWAVLGVSACALVAWALPANAAEEVLPQLPVVARPAPDQPVVGLPSDTHLDKTPPRATKGLDLVKVGWAYNCMDCHKLIASKWHYDRPMAEHRDVKLDHGNNRFCLNCHHPADRNAFVDYDGTKIAEGDVVQLCAKCHGPTYRDWQAGVHGRQNGHWLAAAGEKTKLRCVQCHDPHSPSFKSMQPLAPLRYPARAANPPAVVAGEKGQAHH